MAMYGKVEYWDERYRDMSSKPYDWYQPYAGFRHLLTTQALMTATKAKQFPSKDTCRVLILGCGNSTFGNDMRNDDWKGPISNIDFSAVVIEQMQRKYKDIMDFVCADVTKGLPFEDESFDLIICKGTLDAVLCSSGSIANVKAVVAECSRVLDRDHGIFFLVSFGNPDSRVVFLEHENDISHYWKKLHIDTLSRQNQRGHKNDYVYICRKNSDTPPYRSTSAHHSNDENTAHSAPTTEKI